MSEKRPIKKFKMDPKFPHHRSDGMTKRRNGGSYLQPSVPKTRKNKPDPPND